MEKRYQVVACSKKSGTWPGNGRSRIPNAVPIPRTRVPDKGKHEVPLGCYELFQRSGPLQSAVDARAVDPQLRAGGAGIYGGLRD